MKRLFLLLRTSLWLALLSGSLFGWTAAAPQAHADSPCSGIEVTRKIPGDQGWIEKTECYTQTTPSGYSMLTGPLILKIVNHTAVKTDGSKIIPECEKEW